MYGALGEEGLFTEETPFRPRSPYAASKAAGDLLALADRALQLATQVMAPGAAFVTKVFDGEDAPAAREAGRAEALPVAHGGERRRRRGETRQVA